jgi:hypothetical protein
MRTTQRKGDIAVTRAILTFTEMGFDVALPITESAAYDILVDDGDAVHRVQVRYSTGIVVELRRVHSNSKGYVVKKTKPKVYDWLFVYSPPNGQYLIKECLSNRRSINLNDSFKI